MMIKEHERVVLTVDLPQYQLKQGEVGVVVMIHGNHDGYELEIFSADGRTLRVIAVDAAQIRQINRQDILHVRPMSESA
jgi:hypothetical protein